MPIQIVKSALASRAVRNEIGLRSFSSALSKQEGSGKLIEWIVGGLFRLSKFLISAIWTIGKLTLNALWSTAVQALQFIWTFDWNMSDRMLDRQVQARWSSMAGLLGGLAGNAFGWFSCGILPGISIFSFNRAMGLYVLKEVGEEALDELAANVAVVVQQSFRNLSAGAFVWAFKNWRNWMKQEGNPFSKFIFGARYESVRKNWGKEGGPSWSFAQALDELVEKIPNEFVRNFIEEFLEESWDACVEAGFVVANSVESYLAMQKQQKTAILGAERVVEVIPDREAEGEKIILAGPEELIKSQLPEVLATHQMIENRDVGQWVGESAEEFGRKSEINLRLQIVLYNSPAPPYQSPRNGKVTKVTVTIPDARRSKLDWQDIRLACGGANGYLWGRFRAQAVLTNGRTLKVYGSTAQEAEARLKVFAGLSEAEIRTINVIEELKEGERLLNPGLQKEPTRVYPAYCFVINRERILAGDRGRPVGKYRYRDKRFRLDLWTSTKPYDWDETIQEALTKAGI